MSISTFPSLIGLTWKKIRTPNFETINQEAVSGAETRIALRPYPKYGWKMDFSYLGSGQIGQISNSDFNTLFGFFNERQGKFDSFLITEPDDSSVTGQSIGQGTGSIKAFQMVRTLGGFSEPVLAPNAVSAVYLGGISIPSAGYSAPTTGALTSTAGGALGGATYYVKTTWVTESGETLPSTETSLAVAASHVLNVAHPTGAAPAGAIGWNVYVSTTTGTETLQNGGTPIAAGTAWVEPTSGLVAGSALPSSNTTGWSVATWSAAASNGGAGNPGTINFSGNVANGIAVTADFTYYWPVRFDIDAADFSNDMQYVWSLQKLQFMQVYN